MIVNFFEESGSLSASFSSQSSFTATIRARARVAANFAAQSGFSASVSSIDHNNIVANFAASSRFRAQIKSASGIARFRSRSRLTAVLRSRVGLDHSLNLIVDILPAISGNYQNYTPRFSVDGVSIPIKSFNLNFPKNQIGSELSVQLARISDKSLMTGAASYKFEIGVSGIFTTLFDTATLSGRAHSVGWSNNAPTDTFTVSCLSSLDDKLNKSPLEPVVAYDADRASVSQDEFETLYDTTGAAYPTELIAFRPLTLYALLNLIAQRCGFAGYQTNIPNFQVRRVDFPIEQPLVQSIAGILGAFEPLFFELDDELWIVDASCVLPFGFPSARQVQTSVYRSASKQNNSLPVDAYLVNYTENETEGTAYNTRLEQETIETGDFGSAGFTSTVTERTVRDYYNSNQPNVITKSVVVSETVETTDDNSVLVHRVTDNFTYDSFGRQTASSRSVSSRVPDLSNSGNLNLITVREETISIEYGAHPFEPSRQIQKKATTVIRGLVAVDADNQYFDEDFKQDFLDAHRAGNLSETMTSEFGPLKTITETLKPLSNGQVKTLVRTIDHVRNVISSEIGEVKAGDASLSASASRQRKILVFPLDYSSTKDRRIEPFYIGELPLTLGIPLARRRLARRDGGRDGTITCEIIGIDLGIRRGASVEVTEREDASLGNYLVEGLSLSGGHRQEYLTQVQGVEI